MIRHSRFAFPLILLSTVFALLPGLSPGDEKRHAIYPFDVTVAGQKAAITGKPEFAIFAKIAKPVTNDAKVTVDTDPDTIIVNVFPCDAKGAPLAGAQGKTKIIMVNKAQSFKLDGTLDKSTLDPGLYGMNVVIGSKGTARVMFEVVANKAGAADAAGKEGQSPESVAGQVFESARSGKYDGLEDIVDLAGGDGDVKRLAAVSKVKESDQKEFQRMFKDGKVVGKARITGDKAEVDFLFGPGGKKKETFHLIRKAGRWYLSSF